MPSIFTHILQLRTQFSKCFLWMAVFSIPIQALAASCDFFCWSKSMQAKGSPTRYRGTSCMSARR